MPLDVQVPKLRGDVSFFIFAQSLLELKNADEIKQIALQTIDNELEAIHGLKNHIDGSFVLAVETILQATGRTVVTGIGKSANIAAKIVSTFNSTGTQAMFMHAADAVHGDLGMIRSDDVVICLSKSGNTPEIKVLAPLLKLLGNKLIAVVGNKDSYLAQQADIVLDTTVLREACPNNLAPTSSTTAQLVLGDALAIALLECRGFTAGDFARYHPGGALGKRLYLRVGDLYSGNEKPDVKPDTGLRDVILEISSKRLGCTAVTSQGMLVGIITDGDLRRMLQSNLPLTGLRARDIMTAHPAIIAPTQLVSDALDVMRSKNITQLPVVDDGKYLGIIHLHDILKEGII